MQKQYIGTKLIRAEAMTRAAYNAFRGWPLPADENGQDEGYLVEYLDGGKPNVPGRAGYVSWSPKEQFDNAYRLCEAMTFGLAMEALKRGHCVARAGWNGKGMFAYLVPANAYPAQTGAAKAYFGEGSLVPYNAYMVIKGVDGTVSTWAPSGSDSLAEDWQIVDLAAPALSAQPPVDNDHVAKGCEQFSDAEIERAIQSNGLTAPRVTPADIQANIADIEIVKHISKTGQVLRWAILTTKNGFAVVGKPSAAVSPENDNAEIGEQVAIDSSRAELWPLMGYALKDQLARAATTKADGLPG